MFIGPVFTREAALAPRRGRFYLLRTLYVVALFVLMCTAWLVLAGTQVIRNVGDMARFGSVLFEILAPLQLALFLFLSALVAASAVAQEKDRKTLILLLMTRLTNSEVVIGKLLASLLNVLVMLLAGLPIFMLIVLFGGVSSTQVAWVFVVTLTSALAAGSLGSTLALWREKTFQALAMTALAIVLWIGVWEAVGLIDGAVLGISCETWSTGFSPVHAIRVAASPIIQTDPGLGPLGHGLNLFVIVSLGLAAVLNLVAIARVRLWNPSREVRRRGDRQDAKESIFGVQPGVGGVGRRSAATADVSSVDAAETARAGHVDARTKASSGTSRPVWDNPILWREMRTWAYGRKVVIIRLVYLALFALAAVGLHLMIASGAALRSAEGTTFLPPAAIPLALFILLSLVLVNALAVNSITNERDGRALDLLLVSDLSPREFVFGKLGGVFWVTREMVAAPILLCLYLWWHGGIGLENLSYVLGGLVVMNFFVAMLGVHCGITYDNSKTAIGVSLGTVFFLFLGGVTCILIMISFSGGALASQAKSATLLEFQKQFLPFAAFIVGGGVGLYVSLGARNPSSAITWASILLPIATFYGITSFVLHYPLEVFLVTSATYGFTTLAMLIPAISEFDIAMGRTQTAGDE